MEYISKKQFEAMQKDVVALVDPEGRIVTVPKFTANASPQGGSLIRHEGGRIHLTEKSKRKGYVFLRDAATAEEFDVWNDWYKANMKLSPSMRKPFPEEWQPELCKERIAQGGVEEVWTAPKRQSKKGSKVTQKSESV